jgi:glycosyltransferase involved in cell wall biosynthesis
MLSSSPPDSVHLAAREVARSARIPWIADFRDPWIGLHFREPPTGWHRARQARMERSVLEGADLVLAASRSHADGMGMNSGAKARRVVHLPNGFEPARPAGPGSGAASGARTFRVAFTGTLSQMSDTEQFLDALHELLAHRTEARRRIRVDLCGPYDVHYENRAVALGLSGIVRFTGPLGHADTRQIQREADLLLLWKPRHGTTMVPGKTYEYLDAGRPVLALLPEEDEATDLVRRAGGTIVDPDDRPAITTALAKHYEAWLENGRAPDVRPEWLSGFTREALTGRLASELDSLVQSRA